MNIKGTQSEKNVIEAFKNESQARNKYTYFAIQARAEGHNDIADLFEKMADNEREHAKIWFKIINSGLGTTESNILLAAQGENAEWKTMYPDFAKQAREDGFEMLANMFEKVSAIENDHEKRFIETYLSTFSNKDNTNATTLAAVKVEIPPIFHAADTKEPEQKMHFRCIFCGVPSATRQDVCNVCEAIGSFEPIA